VVVGGGAAAVVVVVVVDVAEAVSDPVAPPEPPAAPPDAPHALAVMPAITNALMSTPVRLPTHCLGRVGLAPADACLFTEMTSSSAVSPG